MSARPAPRCAPLAIDLYAGLGGWTHGLLDAGYYVVGFDNERHAYDGECYPAQLVLQDVLTLDGAQFKDAALIVASPPCQAYSYRAMPWKRAKALPPPDNALFEACFRIQREASAAAGHHIPMVVENVRGAQKWVGRAAWHYGSYYLWGDVPVLMPLPHKAVKVGGTGRTVDGNRHISETWRSKSFANRDNQALSRIDEARDGCKQKGSGRAWFSGPGTFGRLSSASPIRKAASARIAKIPHALALHIARTYYPAAPRCAERAR